MRICERVDIWISEYLNVWIYRCVNIILIICQYVATGNKDYVMMWLYKVISIASSSFLTRHDISMPFIYLYIYPHVHDLYINIKPAYLSSAHVDYDVYAHICVYIYIWTHVYICICIDTCINTLRVYVPSLVSGF